MKLSLNLLVNVMLILAFYGLYRASPVAAAIFASVFGLGLLIHNGFFRTGGYPQTLATRTMFSRYGEYDPQAQEALAYHVARQIEREIARSKFIVKADNHNTPARPDFRVEPGAYVPRYGGPDMNLERRNS